MIARGRPSWTSLSGSGSSVLRRDGDPTSEKRHRVSVFYGDPTRLYQLAFVYVSFMRILYLSSTKWRKGWQGYRAWTSLPSPAACIRRRNKFQGRPPPKLPAFAPGRGSIVAYAGPTWDAEGRRHSVLASSSYTCCCGGGDHARNRSGPTPTGKYISVYGSR